VVLELVAVELHLRKADEDPTATSTLPWLDTLICASGHAADKPTLVTQRGEVPGVVRR
jgi:cytolysin (calcineurin-like family phosphatase)